MMRIRSHVGGGSLPCVRNMNIFFKFGGELNRSKGFTLIELLVVIAIIAILAALNFSDAQFANPPAAFHIISASWSFADGHAEMHRWMDGTTIAYANDQTQNKAGGAGGAQAAAQAGSIHDQQWVGQHYGGPQNP